MLWIPINCYLNRICVDCIELTKAFGESVEHLLYMFVKTHKKDDWTQTIDIPHWKWCRVVYPNRNKIALTWIRCEVISKEKRQCACWCTFWFSTPTPSAFVLSRDTGSNSIRRGPRFYQISFNWMSEATLWIAFVQRIYQKQPTNIPKIYQK